MKTVESVTEGHPDKICDQISDAILDEYLRRDSASRVAVESFGGHGMLVVGGEVSSKSEILDVERIARGVYREIGYGDDLEVFVNIEQQSPDIALGVDVGGAGDQGIMYGYATDETPEFMPAAVIAARSLTQGLANLRKHTNGFSWLGPDGKSQVTMDKGKIKTILVSAQHSESISQEEIRSELIGHLIAPLFGDLSGIEIFVNPTGRFVVGGFASDAGLTGRKLMVDTYGGLLPHGGGAFSGKDASKVDRSASYMCRFVAKNLVAAGYTRSCLVSVAYAIGRAEPLMLKAVSADGKDFSDVVKNNFDFRPLAIIERLGLRKPIFKQTAAYGHFGRSGFPWEEIIKM